VADTPEEERASAVEKAPEQGEGFPAGPFRLRPTFTVSYLDADASLLDTPGTVKDRYLQFAPGLVATAPVREGSFTAEYAPSFRAGASFAATAAPTHTLDATLRMPMGASSELTLQDRFVVSTLDSREADPGGEYFFDLARFNRNLASANARIGFAPRLFVELGSAYNRVSFDQSGGFFSYDGRLASVGLGYELSPNLRVTGSYAYDDVPAPDERPEAEATAHSALLGLDGDILPLLTGRLALGYRDHKSPNAGAGGERYQGFTMTGALTRELGRESSISVLLNRSTPVSNFESNAFYVNTSIQGALSAALPWELSLESGVGYVWNDYETPSLELGVPREDRILGFFAGLRRPVAHRFWVSAFYRRERRRSNLASFDTTSDGILVEVNWGLFGPRR
jgi:Putative beta-barrel porin 2